MRRDFTTRKRIILGVVAFLVVADVALAAYSLELASPGESDTVLRQRALELKRMEAQIKRAQEIRESMPSNQKQYEEFEGSFLPASSGYSSISSELGETAKKSGVRLDDLTFKPTPIPERGMTEVAVDSTIIGNYKSVILFLNGLQRSADNFVIESLTLGTEGPAQGNNANVIKVGLHIKTYLRTRT
jgi:Tfp pilus assembly protein PilO